MLKRLSFLLFICVFSCFSCFLFYSHLFSWALHFNCNCYNVAIIKTSTFDFYFNNNFLKGSIPASISLYFMYWAEYSIFPIQIRKQLTFDYDNIFSKSKTNMDEDKKENFIRIEIVKLGFRGDSICRVKVYLNIHLLCMLLITF